MEKINCPNCGEVCKFVTDSNDIYVGKINQRIWVNFSNYQCINCFDSFTTTEIDELNLFEISKGIRKFKRLFKIKKILNKKTL